MSEPACETCRFFLCHTTTKKDWDEVEVAHTTTLCRRNPVSVVKAKSDWCGEYQAQGEESALSETNELLWKIFNLLTRNNIRKGVIE